MLPHRLGMQARPFAGLVILATLAWAACTPSAAEPTAPADSIQQLSLQVNQHRAEVGCPPLTSHPHLRTVAQGHSEDMARRGFFGHVNPDGKNPFDRLREAGISWTGPAGENIASTRRSPSGVLRLWLDSPDHRANLEQCAYTHHGVGLYDGRWTHLFVTNPSD